MFYHVLPLENIHFDNWSSKSLSFTPVTAYWKMAGLVVSLNPARWHSCCNSFIRSTSTCNDVNIGTNFMSQQHCFNNRWICFMFQQHCFNNFERAQPSRRHHRTWFGAAPPTIGPSACWRGINSPQGWSGLLTRMQTIAPLPACPERSGIMRVRDTHTLWVRNSTPYIPYKVRMFP